MRTAWIEVASGPLLRLQLPQAALVSVSTLMAQDVLAGQTRAGPLTAEDRRGLTPLSWAHVAPCGEVRPGTSLSGELVRDVYHVMCISRSARASVWSKRSRVTGHG